MAFRVLTQVNYSAGENPDGDSGLRFIAGLLLSIVQLDPDFHFYVLVPARHAKVWMAAMQHPRITPIPIEIEPRLHGGDFQFCPVRLSDSFDLRRFDLDVLFLNQPETVPALLNFFNRQTFHNVPAVSYVHWFDTRRPSTPKESRHHPALLGALTGMMVSEAVGCNSQYGKERILRRAAKWFNDATVANLAQRVGVLPPGVEVAAIEAARPTRRRRGRNRSRLQIIVNHRLLKYTGVRALLTDTFPKLWAQRNDFSVVLTNPTRVRLPATITRTPWLVIETLSRDTYLKQLWESDIVIAPHRACHWSISTLEAICAECVPLMNVESFFGEMMEPIVTILSDGQREHVMERWFYYRGSLLTRLNDLMDNISREREVAKVVAAHARLTYDWSNLASRWRQLFHDAESRVPAMSENNPSMRRIVELVRYRTRITKSEILSNLQWAPKQRALSWTSFRKALKLVAREDPSIPESVFEFDRT